MTKDLQNAFDVNDEEIIQLRRGELPAGIKQRILRTSYLLLGGGLVLCTLGLAILLTSKGVAGFASLFLTGLGIIYGGYKGIQSVSVGKLETRESKIKVYGMGGTRRIVLDDKTTFRLNSLKIRHLEPDEAYRLYFVKPTMRVVAIEAIDES